MITPGLCFNVASTWNKTWRPTHYPPESHLTHNSPESHWPRLWLAAWRHQAIIWTKLEQRVLVCILTDQITETIPELNSMRYAFETKYFYDFLNTLWGIMSQRQKFIHREFKYLHPWWKVAYHWRYSMSRGGGRYNTTRALQSVPDSGSRPTKSV